jgi:hypothetical protein
METAFVPRSLARLLVAGEMLFVAWLALDARSSAAPFVIADASVSPVTINSCTPILDKNSQPTIAGIPIPAQASTGIAIEFVNESNQEATLVNFDVNSAGNQFVIRDVGKFSPGVSIKHQYRKGQGQAYILPDFIAPKISCGVASVTFADGTVWRKGQPAQATTPPVPVSGPPLTASPSSLTVDAATSSALFLVSSSARVAAFKETDDCAKVASVFVAATSDASATFSVKPLGRGSCTAHVTDEDGNTVAVPITIQ